MSKLSAVNAKNALTCGKMVVVVGGSFASPCSNQVDELQYSL
jgi:hypothetical protein